MPVSAPPPPRALVVVLVWRCLARSAPTPPHAVPNHPHYYLGQFLICIRNLLTRLPFHTIPHPSRRTTSAPSPFPTPCMIPVNPGPPPGKKKRSWMRRKNHWIPRAQQYRPAHTHLIFRKVRLRVLKKKKKGGPRGNYTLNPVQEKAIELGLCAQETQPGPKFQLLVSRPGRSV